MLLLAVYFSVIGLISGLQFALNQFGQFWYFIIALALGFGIQVGLYASLRSLIKDSRHGEGKVLGVTGTTSAAAMVSCCAHYLVNIAPILGAAGFISLIGQYQVEFFWIGLAFNVFGILYIGRKVMVLRQL